MPEKGIRFQRYVKYKAKCEPNFGGGEKRIKFRGKIEDMGRRAFWPPRGAPLRRRCTYCSVLFRESMG